MSEQWGDFGHSHGLCAGPFFGCEQQLPAVSRLGREIVQDMTPSKTTDCCFYTLVFLRIKQIRYNVLIIELQRCRIRLAVPPVSISVFSSNSWLVEKLLNSTIKSYR